MTIGPLTALFAACYQNSKDHGFHDGEFNIPEKLALVHSEVSEALEAHREGALATQYESKTPEGKVVLLNLMNRGPDGKPLKPVGFMSELADIIIRVGDLAGRMERAEELERVIYEKMEYNRTRPYKHGKAY